MPRSLAQCRAKTAQAPANRPNVPRYNAHFLLLLRIRIPIILIIIAIYVFIQFNSINLLLRVKNCCYRSSALLNVHITLNGDGNWWGKKERKREKMKCLNVNFPIATLKWKALRIRGGEILSLSLSFFSFLFFPLSFPSPFPHSLAFCVNL